MNLLIWVFILCLFVIGYFFENGISCEKIKFPLLTYTFLLFYHDYLFINVSYYLGVENIVFSSSWRESVLVVLFFICFFGKKIAFLSNAEMKIILFSSFFVVLGVVSSIFISNGSLRDTIIIGKGYIYPFLFICTIIILPARCFKIERMCNLFFYIIILPNFIFGIYEYFFVKVLNDIWFYKPLLQSGNIFAYYNHFRDGDVRTNGFFVGTLSYGITGFCSFMFFFILRQRRYSYVKILISLIMVYFTHTRIFYVGILFFLAMYYLHICMKNKKIKGWVAFSSIFIAFILVLVLLPYITQEASAIGRISQWENAISLLLNYPIGQGFSSIGLSGDNRADSQIIDLIRIYGLFSISLFYYFIKVVTFYWNNSVSRYKNNVNSLPYLSIFSFLFVIFFQSLVNVPIFYFMLLLAFKSEVIKREAYYA